MAMTYKYLIDGWIGTSPKRTLLIGIILTLSNSAVSHSATSKRTLRGPESLSKLVLVRLVPEEVNLWENRTGQRFLVVGTYTDGLERDVTSESHFVVSDLGKGKIDDSGRLSALAEGRFKLTARFEGHSAQARIRVESFGELPPFSFARDIGRILTRSGCNDSVCHGGVKGQGGFKLSLQALYPEEDYRWIVEGGMYQVLTAESLGPKNPRITVDKPEDSLLLLKPTLGLPHGGGKRFEVGSSEYMAILHWIQQRAPHGEDGEAVSARVERLEVFPKEIALEAGGEHHLLVTAFLSNGKQEDLTDQVLYVSKNPEVAEVTPAGKVTAVRRGETTVMIRTAGHSVNATVAVIANPIANYSNTTRKNFIDDHVFAKLRKVHIVPSGLSSDAEFLRRICLDVTGTLPPPLRVREFVASKDPQKREKLIELLLNSPEYVDYWTFRFADVFRVSFYANAHSAKDSQSYWEWIRTSVAENKPYDQIARERIAAIGLTGPSRHHLQNQDSRKPEFKMAEEVRVFLGRRLDCAQCHNHPYDAWSQNQFWGMAAFFGRMNLIGVGEIGGGKNSDIVGAIYDDPMGQEVDIGEQREIRKVIHPRTRQEVQPAFFNGDVLPEAERSDLRVRLAERMTSHPYFAEAAVNRIWGYFFGRGIADPVDDFRLNNPPTHPDLLKALAEEFRSHSYDLKHLIRRIVQSRTYQLSREHNETNKEDEINYSHALSRPLDAEVLLDAISQVTGVPEVFEHANFELAGRLPLGTRAIQVKEADIYPSRFLDLYGRANRQVVPERIARPNLGQALHMLAGPTYLDRLSHKGGRIERLVNSGATDRHVIEELYLAALSRFPLEKEYGQLESLFAKQVSRAEAIRNFAWALITSREFATNH